jgi:hypothetical protein
LWQAAVLLSNDVDEIFGRRDGNTRIAPDLSTSVEAVSAMMSGDTWS